ncbi:MAG: ACT domain-containing protein [Frankiaceae bacterium]|nr:ACT domain-containing protein [Frankiaceae bacterium]
MTFFTTLRLELVDHPGSLAAASRVLATQGLNIVEVSIHEVDGGKAVDEIVVSTTAPIDAPELSTALAKAGADLLSTAPCPTRIDPVVTALTWVAASAERPDARGALAAGVQTLTGIAPVQVVPVADAEQIPIGAAALRRGWPIVQRTDELPDDLRSELSAVLPGWVLAAPDSPAATCVLFAARPYAIRFTSTELSRLAAVLDCRRQLIASQQLSLAGI